MLRLRGAPWLVFLPKGHVQEKDALFGKERRRVASLPLDEWAESDGKIEAKERKNSSRLAAASAKLFWKNSIPADDLSFPTAYGS
jgi:hypothetical protein